MPSYGLYPSERETDDLARTVVCPNCEAQPRERCTSNDRTADGNRYPMHSSYLGRLLAARGEQP